jgi:hypothetical protein
LSESGPPDTRPPARKSRWGGALRILLTSLVAVALLMAVMFATILRNDTPASPHGGLMTTVAMQRTTTTRLATGTTASPPTTKPKLLSPFKRATADRGYLAVDSASDTLEARESPDPEAKVLFTYGRNNRFDQPMTFLAMDEQKDGEGYTWYQVLLPEKPNGLRGWLRASEVATRELTHDVRIYLADHRLELYDSGQLVKTYKIGVGKVDTPSPLGEFYIVEKVVPPNQEGDYGVLAMGTTAFSETIKNWPGRAQVGIHGTNAPDTVGQDTTHGCIRLYNQDITELGQVAHLGTPVFIFE